MTTSSSDQTASTLAPEPVSKNRRWRASAHTKARLSRQAGFWAVAFSFLAVTAFSTAPSALYGLYAQRDPRHCGARGGRLPGLEVAARTSRRPRPHGLRAWPYRRHRHRVHHGLGRGLQRCADKSSLARYEPYALTLPFIVVLISLLAAVVLVALAPEGHAAVKPRPRYRPQRLATPANGHGQFVAATTGAFAAFTVGGLFAGLTGTFLTALVHRLSPGLIGLTIFLSYGAGVVSQATTTSWPAHRLLAAGIPPVILGVLLLVASAWTTPPSLGLFLISSVVAGAGVGAMIRGCLNDRYLHRRSGRSGQRRGDAVHRRLRRRVDSGDRRWHRPAASQPPGNSVDLRPCRGSRDPRCRTHPRPPAGRQRRRHHLGQTRSRCPRSVGASVLIWARFECRHFTSLGSTGPCSRPHARTGRRTQAPSFQPARRLYRSLPHRGFERYTDRIPNITRGRSSRKKIPLLAGPSRDAGGGTRTPDTRIMIPLL
jgi:hypothetical protein